VGSQNSTRRQAPVEALHADYAVRRDAGVQWGDEMADREGARAGHPGIEDAAGDRDLGGEVTLIPGTTDSAAVLDNLKAGSPRRPTSMC
jgi:hypothetical protein